MEIMNVLFSKRILEQSWAQESQEDQSIVKRIDKLIRSINIKTHSVKQLV